MPDDSLEVLNDEDLLEAGIDLDDFRLQSQRVTYNTLLGWAFEAKASLSAMAEARASLLDACVYGDYRARRLAADFLGKTLESSIERLLSVSSPLDSPSQVKSGLEARDTGSKKMNPITEALFKLDGQSRENLRNAFLLLLNEAYRLQNPEAPIEVTTTDAEGHGNSDNVSPGPVEEAAAAPEAAPDKRRTRRARGKRRRVSRKPARQVVLP